MPAPATFNRYAHLRYEDLPEIGLGLGIVNLRVKLSVFVQVYRRLIGEVQRDEAREVLVTMAGEVERSYASLVDTIAPLYAIADAGSLSADFPAIRSGFKRHYLKSARDIRVHCGVVMEQLDELLAAKQWKSRLPVAQRSFRELKQLCYQWFDNDVILAEEMEGLLRNLNRVLDRIERSRRADPEDAFDQLSFFLDQTETDFLAMKESIDELAALGRAFR